MFTLSKSELAPQVFLAKKFMNIETTSECSTETRRATHHPEANLQPFSGEVDGGL